LLPARTLDFSLVLILLIEVVWRFAVRLLDHLLEHRPMPQNSNFATVVPGRR
jgi:hypothetical protein